MKEIWKDIPGYEGYYQVSDLGRVRSVDRTIIKKNGRVQDMKGMILKQGDTATGYKYVTLWKGNKKISLRTHQLVAMGFLGHKRCGFEKVVNHKDFDTHNNRLNNLEVVTNRENTSYRKKKGTSKYIGVCYDKYNDVWRADIMINGKQKYIGVFNNEYDAHLAYQEKLKEILANGQ